MRNAWLALAGVNGLIGVAAGAFGAHALKERLAPDLLAVFHTGAQYQMYHALALFGVALLARHDTRCRILAGASWSFLIGIILFSGSLYALALSGVRALGAITPFGGVAFLIGWFLLIVAGARRKSAPPINELHHS
ncbi:MAG: DUF423 domain-containing protein [Phycisphaerales bacterium]|nr:DUF423 domain-containing protein [Phycisphaerales bacterium]